MAAPQPITLPHWIDQGFHLVHRPIKIWNLNMCNHCKRFREKVPFMADKVEQHDYATGKVSDLFAFNECRNRVVLSGLHQQWSRRKFRCGAFKQLTPDCFSIHWAHMRPAPDISHQFGELALLARGGEFTLQGDFIREKIAKVGFLGRGAPLLILGARLRRNPNGYVLPFYSTHIRGDDDRMRTALSNIIQKVHDHYVPGDLPPVVVGDFNMAKPTDPNLFDIMEQEFDELSLHFGHNIIEHFWIGKASAFPGAPMKLVPINGTFDHGNDFAPAEFTDHRIPSVQIITADL